MVSNTFIDEVSGLLEPSRVILDRDKVEHYSMDALTPGRAFKAAHLLENTANLVAKPNTTGEVSALVRLAAKHQVPVVPHGGGTGVMGALAPLKGGMIIDLRGLNRILEISPQNRSVTTEAGIVLEELAKALEAKGLMLGHDPWSVPIATVGGAISTNGVGYRASVVGPMGAQVLGLEVVLPSGQVLTTPSVPKYSSGPNLNALYIGSEGAFGIITKATLRVYRQPEDRTFYTYGFQTFGHGFEAISELFALGLRPAIVDLTEDSDGILLYLIFEGYREAVETQGYRAAQVCLGYRGRDLGHTQALDYWHTRYRIAEEYKETTSNLSRNGRWSRHTSGFDYLHLALPISKVLEYRRNCEDIFSRRHVRVTEYSIWTEPELFSMFLVPEDGAGPEDMPEAVDQVLMLAQDMGGVMEYCHGVGVKLSHLVAREMGVGLEVVKAMKKALDPHNIMNPGKLGL